MNITVIVVLINGAFSLIGGGVGYLKAKSMASLIAGSISGLLLLVCAYGIGQGSRPAALAVLGVALLLGGRFLGTWLKKRNVMPDLVMVILNTATLIAVGAYLLGH